LNIHKYITLTLFLITYIGTKSVFAQLYEIEGKITCDNEFVPFASIIIEKIQVGVTSNDDGIYKLKDIPKGSYTIRVSSIGYKKLEKKIQLKNSLVINFELELLEEKLNEFVITGVSKATRIKENPLAISSVGLKSIEQSNESNIMDVLQKNSTGVSMLKTGPNISKPFIRGLGYNRVLTLFDGIRQEGQQWGDEHGLEVDAYGMQSIEVIKGPASLMYGSDAVAGVVSFIPQFADTTLKGIHGKIVNEYQHNNNLIGNGAYVNQTVNKLTYSFNASHRLAKNYRNKADGRVYNTGFEELNLSGKILLRLKKSDLSLNATLYDNVQGIPDGSRDSTTRQFTYQQFEGDDDDIKNRPLVSNEKLNSYAPADLHQQIKHYRLYLKQNFDFGKSKLNYLLAWQYNIRKEITHPTDLAQAGLFVKLNTANYSALYQLPETNNRLTAVGINGMWQNNKNADATDFPIPNYQLFDIGLFVHNTWKWHKITLSTGLRYDLRKVNVYDLYTILNPMSGFSTQTLHQGNPENYHQYKAFNKIFDGISGSAGLSYVVNEHWHFKANLSRGYRAPGITELASNGLDPGARIIYLGNQQFKAEFSNQQDIGAFYEHKNFDISLSLFNNYIQNYIYLAQLADENNVPITDAQGNKTFQYQQSKAQLYGLEANFTVHPQVLNGFSLTNNFQFVHGYNKNEAFKNTKINGGYLPFIPPAQWNMIIAQNIKLKKWRIKNLSPRFELEYHGKQARFMALYGTETFTPDYLLLHAALQIALFSKEKKQLNLHLFVNNLTDKIYQSNMSRLKYFEYFEDTRANSSGIYNMGRNIGAKLIYHF
jgi:iron complex outermembrane recepter protein